MMAGLCVDRLQRRWLSVYGAVKMSGTTWIVKGMRTVCTQVCWWHWRKAQKWGLTDVMLFLCTFWAVGSWIAEAWGVIYDVEEARWVSIGLLYLQMRESQEVWNKHARGLRWKCSRWRQNSVRWCRQTLLRVLGEIYITVLSSRRDLATSKRQSVFFGSLPIETGYTACSMEKTCDVKGCSYPRCRFLLWSAETTVPETE